MGRYLIFFLLFVVSCSSFDKNENEKRFYDYENEDNKYLSSSEKYSGNYSLKVGSRKKIMLDTVQQDFTDIKFDITAKINLTCSEVYLQIAGKEGDFYFTKLNEVSSIDDKWSQIRLQGYVSPVFSGKRVEIYFLNNCDKPVYVDDVTVVIERDRKYTDVQGVEKINLDIENDYLDSIYKYRERAIENGYISKLSKQYVPAQLQLQNNSFGVKMRLKGDWIDHLYGDKWSYRVVQNDPTIDTSFAFSLHKVEARNYLMEYVYHQLLQKVGVLTVNYDFVNLNINNKSLGLYVKEEHIDGNFLASRGLSSVVLKFDDSSFFQDLFSNKADAVEPILSAEIKSYQTDKEDVSTIDEAKKLMHSYRSLDLKTSELFDVNELAKFYAITDFCMAYHALGWINTRFSYNKETNKLSPIAYDGYSEQIMRDWGVPFLGYSNGSEIKISDRNIYTVLNWFNDSVFVDEYYHQLEVIDIDNLVQDIFPKVRALEKIIQVEYPEYKFDYNFHARNSKKIKQVLYGQLKQGRYPNYSLN